MNGSTWGRWIRRQPWFFPFLLMLLVVAINAWLQPAFFSDRSLQNNVRNFVPLILLATGQTLVVLAGGIDLSVGAIFSMATAIIVTQGGAEPSWASFGYAVFAGAIAGMLAGALNGFCVSFLRLQPIVTTYATSFIFGGVALWVLPRPGGAIPDGLDKLYRSSAPLGIPIGVYIAAVVILLWVLIRATRLGRYLFAVGGDAQSAYASGVPVSVVRFSAYVISGLMAAAAALSLALATASGNPRAGEQMTLDSVVAVVLGGTRLSGGHGGVAGTVFGVVVLFLIRSIISFANVDRWWQTFVDAVIIITALALPGILRLVRRQTPVQ